MSKAFTKDEAWEEPIIPPRAPVPTGVPNYVTPRGLLLLRAELAALEADRHGLEADRSDEDEYRRRLAILTVRTSDLTARIASAVVVDPRRQPRDAVRFGAMVTLRTVGGEHAGEERHLEIVGIDEADDRAHRARDSRARSRGHRRPRHPARQGSPGSGVHRLCGGLTMAAIPWARFGEDHMLLMMSRILVGLLLLVLGRRLYWLFVAAIGFLYGLELAPRLLPQQSGAMLVIIALVLAVVGALLAGLATKVALGAIGFVAAGGIAALALQHLSIDSGLVVLGVYLIAGLIGAVLFLLLFNAALIVLSSLAGAYLIVLSAEQLRLMSPTFGTALFIVLAVAGIVVQARPWRSRRPPPP